MHVCTCVCNVHIMYQNDYVYIYICVCVCVCMYVCMYACMYGPILGRRNRASSSVRWMPPSAYGSAHNTTCMDPEVCLHVCMHPYRVYIICISRKDDIYIYIYIHTHIYT